MSDEARERAAVEHHRPGGGIVKARDIAVPLSIGTRMWYHNTTHVPVKMPTTFRDDLETVNASRLRASGASTADATSADPRSMALYPERYLDGGPWKDLRGTRWSS